MALKIVHHYAVPEFKADLPSSAYVLTNDVPPGTTPKGVLTRGEDVVLYVEKPHHAQARDGVCSRLEAFFVLTGEAFQDTLFDDNGRPRSFAYVGSVGEERPNGHYVRHVYARITS